jgi:hypothetical protein
VLIELAIALAIGLLAGTHTATWGMYKDSPHEGFTYRRYSRSILVSGMIAPVVWSITSLDVTQPGNMVVLFGFTYGIERALVEFYKTFVRNEDQSKYFIPMQFHVKGKVVKDPKKRLWIAIAYGAGVFLVIGGIYYFERLNLRLPVMVVLLFGTAGGWISAFGGAWKDAPLEGFELLKFFRSPLIALIYAILLACFTKSYLFICVGALGYTVATIETYKTFFFPSKPRGKFAGKPILFPGMLSFRQRFVPVYITIWLAVIAFFVAAFTQPRSGLI